MFKKISLTRLQPKFGELVKSYLQQHRMTQGQLADMVGIKRTHLCQLINNSPHRPLTAYYLTAFLRKGIIKVSQINDGHAESEREDDFWKTATEAENYALLHKIAKLRDRGIDVADLLERMYPDI